MPFIVHLSCGFWHYNATTTHTLCPLRPSTCAPCLLYSQAARGTIVQVTSVAQHYEGAWELTNTASSHHVSAFAMPAYTPPPEPTQRHHNSWKTARCRSWTSARKTRGGLEAHRPPDGSPAVIVAAVCLTCTHACMHACKRGCQQAERLTCFQAVALTNRNSMSSRHAASQWLFAMVFAASKGLVSVKTALHESACIICEHLQSGLIMALAEHRKAGFGLP